MVRELNSQRRPNLLGIGAAKAGTTWLASVLSAHPDVFMPGQKELNALHYDDLEQRLLEYEEYFSLAQSQKIRCDFSVRYLASKNAPTAAARYVPDAKILMLVRNPVDQIQSHYWHLLRQNFHQARPLESRPSLFEALENFPDLLLEPALYGKHINRWLGKFPRDRFFFIRESNLSQQIDTVMSDLCNFLDIELFDFEKAVTSVSVTDARGGVRPRAGVLGSLYPHIYVAIVHGPMRWMKSVFGVRRTDAIKRASVIRQLSEAIFFVPGYEKLDEDGRERLLDIVRDDLERFGELTDFDVSSWIASQRC